MNSVSSDEFAARYMESILNQRLVQDRMWGQACCAYNLHIRPSREVLADLEVIQDSISRSEPNLLRVPSHALHVSVLPLLGVRRTYSQSKDAIWGARHQDWLTSLSNIAANSSSIHLTYNAVVATDTAVIAWAEPIEQIHQLRNAVATRIGRDVVVDIPEIVHTTLFRYRDRLTDPKRFLELLRKTKTHIHFSAEELLVVRENQYPSLQLTVLKRVILANDSGVLG